MLSCSLRDVRCHVLKMGAVSRGDGASVRIIYTTPHSARAALGSCLVAAVFRVIYFCSLFIDD